MRLGPLTITLSRPASRDDQLGFAQRIRRPALEELGAPGTQNWRGPSGFSILGATEYNTDLLPPKAYDVYDKMRRSDGTVRALLHAIKLPLLQVEWRVEAASDSARDREIAEFINVGLHSMTISWQDFLRQALLHLDYGSMLFEKVWRIAEGRVALRKLAPRLPRTVLEWRLDESGGLAGIKQQVIRNGVFEQPELPVEKLLVFVNELEGADYRGVSVLRAAYKHWYYKDGLYRVDAIAKEKRSLGVDIGTLEDPAATTADKEDLERALMSLHAHEKQYLVEIKGKSTYRIEGVGRGGLLDALGSIEHHDVMILRSMLAEFVALGQAQSGSWAMSRDKSSFFLMVDTAIADNISAVIDRHLIKQWVDYNWAGVTEYPRLTHSRLDTRNVELIADAVQKLAGAGMLTPSDETEDAVRDMLELPELVRDQAEAEMARPPRSAGGADMLAELRNFERYSSRRKRGRSFVFKHVPAETARRLNAALGSDRAVLLAATNAAKAKALDAKARDELAALALALENGDIESDEFVMRAQKLLGLTYAQAYLLGGGDEDDDWPEQDAESQRSYLAAFAVALVLSRGARSRVGIEPGEALPPDAPADIAKALVSPEAIASRAALYSGRTWAAYQRGRVKAAPAESVITWHSEDDETTCVPCAALDGQEFTADDLPGFPGPDVCDGLGNCRCWLETSTPSLSDVA